eukprot:s4506_g3.t2
MEEANYDDDDDEEGERTKDTENENENDGNGENDKDDNAPAEKAQPKQGAKKRRRGGRNARGKKQKEKDTEQVQEDKKQVADTLGRSILTAKMKKTRMCDFHKEGRCKYGEDCAFAHDEKELQSAPDLRKTRLCKSFLAGKCDDRDCKFAHGEEELRASDICFKTALCTWFEKGTCQSGSQCRFAHGEDELRDDPEAKDGNRDQPKGFAKGRARKRMSARTLWVQGMPTEPSRKRKEPEPVEDLGLGGLYDFLPPPDPEKDKATAAKARKAEQANSKPKLPPTDRSRVIFLDVDGVLLPAGSVEMIYIDGVMLPVRAAKEADFSRVALQNLRSIVQQTGATIVVSSEWRRREEMRDNIRRTLTTQDIPGFQDSTPIFQPSAELVKQRLDQAIIWAERRAREIGSWLKQHKEVKAWVAIDDIDFSWADSVKVPGTPLMKHRSVLTNPKHCITEKARSEDDR